jgi:hypothetical protein
VTPGFLAHGRRVLVAVEPGPGRNAAKVLSPTPVGIIALEGEGARRRVHRVGRELSDGVAEDGVALMVDEVDVLDVVEVDDDGKVNALTGDGGLGLRDGEYSRDQRSCKDGADEQ